MDLTLRTSGDNYIDVTLDVSKRELIFMSPIPGISMKSLMNLCDLYHYTIILPITGTKIIPDKNLSTKDISDNYSKPTEDTISLLLNIANSIVSE